MALLDKIKRHIIHSGPIGIAEFMVHCLYDKDYGYYTTKRPIGSEGDFITAPEISQTFGEMLGIWVTSEIMKLPNVKDFHLVELGAGRGTLLKDVLRVLRGQSLDKAAKITIIETNPFFKSEQLNQLSDYKINWCAEIEEIKNDEDLPIIVIANEFLDCFPIRQFQKHNDGWRERLIGIEDDELCFGFGPPLLTPPENAIENDDIGTIREVSIGLEAFIQKLSNKLDKCGGSVLFIDYGHFGDETGDSFQALLKHKKISPLQNVGECDLTAHVDFSAIELAARKYGMMINGPNTQGELLKALGIVQRRDNLMFQNPNRAEEISNSVNRLIDQDGMGELFKAIIISKERNYV